jgi:TM2 domain-containing membrane protein YozV
MSVNRRKSPIIAGVLSFVFPGAGHLYNEEFIKGVVLIAGSIASIVSIVYTALSLVNQGGYQVAVPIVKIVTASLILFGIWLYGIIDAIIIAQRLSANPNGSPAEAVSGGAKTKEGTIALGVVLVLFGIICIAVQLGLKYEYLVKYGLPAALILFGGYLLAKTSGLIKGGK